jgi:hypothetical protein
VRRWTFTESNPKPQVKNKNVVKEKIRSGKITRSEALVPECGTFQTGVHDLSASTTNNNRENLPPIAGEDHHLPPEMYSFKSRVAHRHDLLAQAARALHGMLVCHGDLVPDDQGSLANDGGAVRSDTDGGSGLRVFKQEKKTLLNLEFHKFYIEFF